MNIIPAILATNFEEFKTIFQRVEHLGEYVHIDVMDGVFVKNTSFQDIKNINNLATATKFELHLMVEHPIEEMKRWVDIKNVFRVLFHIEALDSPEECIEYAKSHSWEKGLVLNPQTPLYRAESYFPLIDVLQFMTVEPGLQGQPFLPEVGEKIRSFTQLSPRPVCSVDGSVNKETIGVLKSWGVEIFNVGSALTTVENAKQVYQELKNLI